MYLIGYTTAVKIQSAGTCYSKKWLLTGKLTTRPKLLGCQLQVEFLHSIHYMRDHCHNPSHSIKYYQLCSYVSEQDSIIQETLSPCQEHCKSKGSMQVRQDKCGCKWDRRHIHCSQIYVIWSYVWYRACEFVITQIPTHSRCQHTHTSQKRNWLS